VKIFFFFLFLCFFFFCCPKVLRVHSLTHSPFPSVFSGPAWSPEMSFFLPSLQFGVISPPFFSYASNNAQATFFFQTFSNVSSISSFPTLPPFFFSPLCLYCHSLAFCVSPFPLDNSLIYSYALFPPTCNVNYQRASFFPPPPPPSPAPTEAASSGIFPLSPLKGSEILLRINDVMTRAVRQCLPPPFPGPQTPPP